MTLLHRPVNWNRMEDPIDLEIWTKLTNNFWLDTKIAVSNDIPSWNSMTNDEKMLVKHIFTGLTLLDTIQGTVGAPSLIPDAITPHEAQVYTWIAAQEAIHAKSYSTIFSTLCSTQEIEEAYLWSENNPYLQKKAEIVLGYYDGDNPFKKKIASTLLESFLFYSGFYTPLHFSSRAKIPNAADIIRLIIRDEGIHGYYIGYKYQQSIKSLTEAERADLHEFTIGLLLDLYGNEIQYTQDLYDPVGLTGDVKRFLKYNANKALMNLGYDPIYPKDETNVSPSIMTALAPASENHDFFSGAGSSYTMAKVEEMSDDDWDLD